MNHNIAEQDFVVDCTMLAELYQKILLAETIEACPAIDTDPWNSLRFFLKGYAFERQGRSPDYSPAAADILAEFHGQPLTSSTARKVWRNFVGKVGADAANHANNPLCPHGTKYERKHNESQHVVEVSDYSAVEIVADDLGGQCIVAWARQKLQSGEAGQAHATLKKINGVGTKIASFFLRDIATLYSLEPAKDRTLLQPIDTWIRNVAHYLKMGKMADDLKSEQRMVDGKCAAYILEQASQAPEAANQGLWYFCAQVAGSSKYLVRRSIDEPGYRDQLIRQHLSSLTQRGPVAAAYVARRGITL